MMTTEDEPRVHIPWTRDDEAEYQRARRDVLGPWGKEIRERLALAAQERERVAAKRRTGPGALEVPDGQVTPPASSKQRRYHPAMPVAPKKPPRKCLDCPAVIAAHRLRCGICAPAAHRKQERDARRYRRCKTARVEATGAVAEAESEVS